ncbi:MAG: phosphatidylserine decarboxylase [Alphaproteobacteria bacterium]|nr:phosphatidylserine decarboxylase [Alphaproteobacteria bacterium]
MNSREITWKDYLFPPLHPEGPGFLALFAFATFILWLIWSPLGLIGLALTVWCFYFFRDPDRVTPIREGLVISPADGVVQSIIETTGPPELDLAQKKYTRVSVFMSVFDCHVNRIPIAGEITKEVYVPGLFLNATLDKASADNERQCLQVMSNVGKELAVVQIAGLVARRIRCDVQTNQHLETGERIGLIRFGSRVDVYLPRGTHPLVSVGQKMVAGETVIADFKSREAQREGEVR